MNGRISGSKCENGNSELNNFLPTFLIGDEANEGDGTPVNQKSIFDQFTENNFFHQNVRIL